MADPWDFESDFGMPLVVALEALTRSEGETYVDYIEGIAAGYMHGATIAREVKLADLRDNLGRIPPKPPIRRLEPNIWARDWGPLKARYEKAIATLEGAA